MPPRPAPRPPRRAPGPEGPRGAAARPAGRRSRPRTRSRVASPWGEPNRLAIVPEDVVHALAELQERSVRAFAVSGAWFGHRGKRLRMAWVTKPSTPRKLRHTCGPQ